jgi:hypothetical protein
MFSVMNLNFARQAAHMMKPLPQKCRDAVLDAALRQRVKDLSTKY